ncbi:hypothetical protein [Haloarcula nitratireducens]|uniref:Uncharacterized protein n=1 Tax=Haloarcula nitratireducens TaxID=2487749 RepID=A0AAW4PD09_9EURY|nr:hypothetical protein [Halomicroarcula nitratireducens]MBX0295483.1 hypothetical protein [Halomicroarcula nitratireducens]
MSVIGLLQRLLQGARSCIVYECRMCGMKMPQHSESCHQCGSTEIARYDLC